MISPHCLSAFPVCSQVFKCVSYVYVVLYDHLYLWRVKLELGKGGGVIYDSLRNREGSKLICSVSLGGRGSKWPKSELLDFWTTLKGLGLNQAIFSISFIEMHYNIVHSDCELQEESFESLYESFMKAYCLYFNTH